MQGPVLIFFMSPSSIFHCKDIIAFHATYVRGQMEKSSAYSEFFQH